MASEIDNILANLGATNSTGRATGYDELQIGVSQIDTRFESTFDIIRKAALVENTPHIFGKSDTCEAIVLRSEGDTAAPSTGGGAALIAYCKIINSHHTTLLPDPTTLDPTDFLSQALISAFPKFRYSAVDLMGVLPPGTKVNVTFDPGSLQGGTINLPGVPACIDVCPTGSASFPGALGAFAGGAPGAFFRLPPGSHDVGLLFGDSQSDGGSTLGGHLPKELKEKGVELKVEAKYGKGLISGKEHWDIENPAGIAQKALAAARPGFVIVELGGNDSYWVGSGNSTEKQTRYAQTIQKWVSTIQSYGVKAIIWFGPSKATKIGSNGTPYDSLRQNVRNWQQEILGNMSGVTWHDTVPYTEGLPMKTDGVHFIGSSYKEWANRLVQLGAPLGGLKSSTNAGATT